MLTACPRAAATVKPRDRAFHNTTAWRSRNRWGRFPCADRPKRPRPAISARWSPRRFTGSIVGPVAFPAEPRPPRPSLPRCWAILRAGCACCDHTHSSRHRLLHRLQPLITPFGRVEFRPAPAPASAWSTRAVPKTGFSSSGWSWWPNQSGTQLPSARCCCCRYRQPRCQALISAATAHRRCHLGPPAAQSTQGVGCQVRSAAIEGQFAPAAAESGPATVAVLQVQQPVDGQIGRLTARSLPGRAKLWQNYASLPNANNAPAVSSASGTAPEGRSSPSRRDRRR